MKVALMALIAISLFSGMANASISSSDDPNLPESKAGKVFAQEKAKTDCARRAAGNAHSVAVTLAGKGTAKQHANSTTASHSASF